jgi:hypothetical protein
MKDPMIATGDYLRVMECDGDLNLVTLAPRVGRYEIGGEHGLWIHLEARPSWLHRTMIRWAFGWKWVDE